MKFLGFGQIEAAQWDEVVEASGDAWLYHRSDYIRYAERQGNTNLSFAALTDSGEIVGICPLYLSVDGRYTNLEPFRFVQRALTYLLRKFHLRGPWSFRVLSTAFSGPAVSGRIGMKGRKRVFKEIAKYLHQLGAEVKADEIHVRFSEMAPTNTSGEVNRLSLLWTMGFLEPIGTVPRSSIVIDLNQDIEKIRGALDEDCRAEINRAVREGCTAIVNPPQGVERYAKIHEVSWNRTMGHAHPVSHFIEMASVLGDAMHTFLARHSENDVAGVLLHVYKDSAMYWGGCSLLEGQRVKANNFLLYEAIKWCKEKGLARFCVGIFDSYPGPNVKEYGVGQYKAQFSSLHHEALEGRSLISRRALKSEFKKKALFLGQRKKTLTSRRETE